MLMANTTPTSRLVVRMPDGTVIEADTPEHLTAAIVAVRRASDAMSITTTPRRTRGRRKDEAEEAQQSLGARWTTAAVQKLLSAVTEAANKLLRTTVMMPQPVTVAAISERMKTRAGGIGPLIARLSRDAQDIAPDLPPPLRTEGRVGQKVLAFDPTFLSALKEVLPTS